MCLISKTNIPLIAEEDIECYKIICLIKNGVWVTPAVRVPISKDVLDGKVLLKAEGKKDIVLIHNGNFLYNRYITEDSYKVGKGFIHTFAYGWDAGRDMSRAPEHSALYKCVIPKGTAYLKGYDEYCGYDVFASEAIKFVEFVEDSKMLEAKYSLL